MPSKEVTDREKAVRDVVAAAETHGAAAADALTAQLGPLLKKGEKMPDVALLMALMARRLDGTGATLVRADEVHEKELGDDAEPRDRRDAAAATLYATSTEVRDQIASVNGDGAVTALGITGPTPTDASELATWASSLIKGLRDKALVLPPPKRRTARIDREVMAEELEAALLPLTRALKDVSRERREAEATQATKNAAMTSHDAAFSQTAGLCTALFRASGLDHVADRVRPSRRRPGRTEADDPVEPSNGEKKPA
jgi:hypothetical protein